MARIGPQPGPVRPARSLPVEPPVARLPAPSWGKAVARLLANAAMSEDNKIRLARGMGHLPPCEQLRSSGYPRRAELGRLRLTGSSADPTIVLLRLPVQPRDALLTGVTGWIEITGKHGWRHQKGEPGCYRPCDHFTASSAVRDHASWAGSSVDPSSRDRGLGHHQQDALALQQLEVLEGLRDRGDAMGVEVAQVRHGQVHERGRPRPDPAATPGQGRSRARRPWPAGGILDQLLEEVLGSGDEPDLVVGQLCLRRRRGRSRRRGRRSCRPGRAPGPACR